MDMEEDFYNSETLSPKMIGNFMFSWIEKHIKLMDKDFGRFINDTIGI